MLLLTDVHPIFSHRYAMKHLLQNVCGSILAITLQTLIIEQYGSHAWGNGKIFLLHSEDDAFQPSASFKLHLKFKIFHCWIEIVP